jgi:beta-N-acetylhexosaminidase
MKTHKELFYLIFISLFIFQTIKCRAQNPELSKIVSIDEKIGQMLLIGFRGTEINEKSKIVQDIKRFNLGCIIIFDYDQPSKSPKRNIVNAKQLKLLCSNLQKYAPTKLFIGIDQEGGKVNRLKTRFGFPPTVSAQYLGKLNNSDTIKKYSESTAAILSELGINLNFAPCVDLNSNPLNPAIGWFERSFSADPKIVSDIAMEIVNINNRHNVISTLKHFPGHGSSKDDSHLGFVNVTDTWESKELIPYSTLIKSGNCDMIMTAHIFNSKLDPVYPATLSKKILTHILRDSLGYNGVIISDDMQMKAIAEHYGLNTAIEKAINAGVDILSFANNTFVYEEDIAERAFTTLKDLVESGKISKERIDESYQRIMKLKNKIR